MDNQNDNLLITIFSDSNFLAVNLFEILITKKCYINIITSDVSGWLEKTKQITNNSRFSILEDGVTSLNVTSTYTFFFGGFINKADGLRSFEKFVRNNYNEQTKTVAIFPFEIFDKSKNDNIQLSGNLSVVYVGDLFGPRFDLESDLLSSVAINEILASRSLTLGVGEIFYPIFVRDAAKIISKWMLSFGPFGKEVFLLGPQTSGSKFWNENEKIVSNISLKYDEDLKVRNIPRNYEIETVNSDTHLSLVETYRWLSVSLKNGVVRKRKKEFPKIPKIRKVIKIPKPVKLVSIFTTIILAFPILCLLISLLFFYISFKEFVSGKENILQGSILTAKTFSVLAKGESGVLSYVPILGRVYKEVNFAGNLGERFSDIAINAVPVVKNASEMFSKVLGDEIYDPSVESDKIKVGLDYLYQDISLLEVVTNESSEKGIILAKSLEKKVDLARFRNLTLQGKNLSENLPKILGKGNPQTYLVLFENNMELRPTGGFIGSYGLMTFDNGRMSDLTVNDVYSADGQLNGHVEPPAPIKNYLGEANWWLRDSNWDPDFPTSAKRAEWFLNKEIGREVEGVIAIDLEPIRNILKYTGSIFLPDFNLDISDKNLYEKTQSEVQDNFFPGTHKKASFLTALSRSLLTNIEKIDGKNKLLVLKSLGEALEGRHLQIFLHDAQSQDALGNMSWDGSVAKPSCGENCYADLVGLVEANVGVNKANYFIKKDVSLETTIHDNEIDRQLTLNIKNSANTALGPSGRYKVYLRLLVSGDSDVVGVSSIVGDSEENISADVTEMKDRKEIGVLVEVLGGQSKTVNFLWKTNLSKTPITSYGLFVRKQAGSSDDPLRIEIGRDGYKTTAPLFSLTQGGASVYNTVLARDFFSRITWTKKF